MKIKYQLITTVVSFAIVLLVISLSIFFTNERVAQLSNQQDTMVKIHSTVNQLYYVSNEYFLRQTDSQLQSWQSKIAAISGNLTELNMKDPEQDSSIFIINYDIQGVDHAFRDTVSYLQAAPRNQSVRILPEFQIVWSALTDKIQTLSNDSAQLSQLILTQSNEAEMANLELIVILLAVFAIYLLINFILIYQNALKPISELQAGMNIVGSGNLNYHVKVEKKNEVGDLSNSFNRMTVSLKNMTAKLQEQERMAAIGQTAGMVGHDLRNPLQTISGEVYLARNELRAMPESELKTSMQESVDAIEEQISYMDKIVSDLQTFVRPVQVNKQVFDLKQFFVDRLAEIGVPKNVKTKVQVQEGLVMNADPQLMKRVLINLITNAIQAMPEGGELRIKAQENAAKVKISVEDTGVGIPEEIKSKLFTPLFTTKSKGQGFGLAVCKRVIEAQGGKIDLQGEEGKGTKVIIEMPLAP
jgi:signal transduction histidine kinase